MVQCQLCYKSDIDCKCVAKPNTLITEWEQSLSTYNLKYHDFPPMKKILTNIGVPYEEKLVKEFLNAVMSQRAAQYWYATPCPVPPQLNLRIKGLIMDLRGDGY